MNIYFLSAHNFTIPLKYILVFCTFPKFSSVHKLNSLAVFFFQAIIRAIELSFLILTWAVSLISIYGHIASPSSQLSPVDISVWFMSSCISTLPALYANHSCLPGTFYKGLLGEQMMRETVNILCNMSGCFHIIYVIRSPQLLTGSSQSFL